MRPLKGLYTDSLPINQPEGTYRDAKNINLNADIGSITTEEGLSKINTSLPTGIYPMHYDVAPDRGLIIFYKSDTSSGIGILKDDSFDVKLEDSNLNFSKTSEIHSTVKLDNYGNLLVYWTDNINPPRVYNLDSTPTYDNINELNIFDFISSIGNLSLESIVETGGNLLSGSYVFALRYIDEDDNRSNFFSITRPIPIIPNSSSGFIQGLPTIRTSKAIRLQLNNLDTSYQEVEVAVIRFEENTIAETLTLTPIPISETSYVISYSGYSGTPISLEEITINKVSYTKAKTLGQLDNVLYMGNLTRDAEIDYQKYANNIKTYSITKEADISNLSDNEFVFKNKNFRRGEVYAFYISFVLNDGTETEAFHIPGREGTTSEKATVTEGTVEAEIAPTAQRFHFFPEKDATYGMAFWQNNPLDIGGSYPNNDKFDIIDIDSNGNETQVGTLRNEPVRHHRFPDEFDNPVLNDTDTVNVLGVQFYNVKIPTSLKDKIKGIKFHYAEKNSSNRLILDEGFATPQSIVSTSNWDIIDETVLRNSDIENTITNFTWSRFSISPFSSMLNMQNVSNVHYLMRTRKAKTSQAARINQYDFEYIVDKKIALSNSDRESSIMGVNNISYYDSNIPIINTKDIGFDTNKSSYLEPSGIVIEANNPNGIQYTFDGNLSVFDISPTLNVLDKEFGSIIKMCTFKTSVHNPFYQETLCSLTPVDTDIDKYDPTVTGSAKRSNQIYSGDTFISNYSQLISFDRDVGAGNLSQAIVRTIVQSYDHVNWRQPGTGEFEFNVNNPGVKEDVVNAYRNEAGVDEFFDNYYAYDSAYSIQAYLKGAIPDQAEDVLRKTIPTRVIRSAEENFDTQQDNFRTFLENDYLDIPSSKGEITKIASNNGILIIHTKNALFRTRGKEELASGDFRAFLGSGDIFEVQPTELFNTKYGFAGLQDVSSAVETPIGYFFVDSFNKGVYLLSDKANDLTEFGMKNFFRRNLEWYIDEVKSHHDIPFTKIVSDYDSDYNRLLLTKVDYKPTTLLLNGITQEDVEFNESTYKYKFSGGADIEYSNADYFEDKSFTLSFLPEINAWISFHDYKPLFYMNDGDTLRSFNLGDSSFYNHNDRNADYANFYGTNYGMHLQVVDNREPTISKQLVNVEFITSVLDKDNNEYWKETFDRLRIRNNIQDSNLIDLVYFTLAGGNLRNIEGSWRINKFRDMIDPDTGILNNDLAWHKQKKFIGKYAIIDLYYDNPESKRLSLTDITANFKQSIR